MILTILFSICILALLHTYVAYPLLLQFFCHFQKSNTVSYGPGDKLPSVTVLISAYNEEHILEEKIRSVFNTDYPIEKLEIIIGSDGSTDRTNEILGRMKGEFPRLRAEIFKQRLGKGNVLNRLVPISNHKLLLLTDAKVIFNHRTIPEIITFFKDPGVGLTGGRLVNLTHTSSGISVQEEIFMNREFTMKQQEGQLWGTVAGAYGALYAVRRELFPVIPSLFTVDDFFVTLSVSAKGYRCLMNPAATGLLNVPGAFSEEFRRKVRISIGNYQNLVHFLSLAWPPYTGLSFSFVSHKVLRWLGPFFILGAFVLNLFLFPQSDLYKIALLLQVMLLIMPLIDSILRKFNIHIVILRFVSHFYGMNAALLAGFFKYIRGIKSNVWEPTKR